MLPFQSKIASIREMFWFINSDFIINIHLLIFISDIFTPLLHSIDTCLQNFFSNPTWTSYFNGKSAGIDILISIWAFSLLNTAKISRVFFETKMLNSSDFHSFHFSHTIISYLAAEALFHLFLSDISTNKHSSLLLTPRSSNTSFRNCQTTLGERPEMCLSRDIVFALWVYIDFSVQISSSFEWFRIFSFYANSINDIEYQQNSMKHRN